MESNIEIFQTADHQTQIEVRFEGDTVWLTQPQIVTLFDSSKANISEHIRHIFDSRELDKDSTVRNFRTVQKEGRREVERDRPHYNLDMIISVGYRVNSKRGTQFRQWATRRLKDYLVQGYAINEKRLAEKEQTIEEKAATLLYLIVKNHPFVDGNKRIGAACFLYFLDRNNLLKKAECHVF